MKNKYDQFKKWAHQNPKKVYKYSMIVILISFLFTALQYIFFPPDFKPKMLVPNLYSKSAEYKVEDQNRENKMGEIVTEMQSIEKKGANLSSRDSVRLKYLYTEYQNVKNGVQKN